MTTAQALMEARAMRRTAGEMQIEIDSMAHQLCVWGDATNWEHPALERFEMVIRHYERERSKLLDRARALESGVAA